MNVSVATSGLHQRHLYEIPFFPSKQSLRIMSRLLAKSYVTVHHGFDTKLLPARTRKTDYSSTKNFSMQQWGQIVLLLRKEGIEVVQLGVVEEEKIEGVTNCLNGQTSFEETALLIKHSLCHIDTEGGLVHLAHAVHGPVCCSIRPHADRVFRLSRKYQFAAHRLQSLLVCDKNLAYRVSAAHQRPGLHERALSVQRGRRREEDRRGVEEAFCEGDRGRSENAPPTLFGETIASARTVVSRNTANRVLFIFDDLPASIGAELAHSVPEGSDVIICADRPSRWGSNDRSVGRFEYGSLINLPRASSSIDAAVWVSCEVESDIAPFALREIFRVLKPGGELVFAAVGKSTSLDLRHSLAAARIGFDEDEMPLAPVYSFSLRKNGGQQAVGLPPRVRGPETTQARSHAVDPRLALMEQENAAANRPRPRYSCRATKGHRPRIRRRGPRDSARVRRRRMDMGVGKLRRWLSGKILFERMGQPTRMGDF